jgi:hypothetical protein
MAPAIEGARLTDIMFTISIALATILPLPSRSPRRCLAIPSTGMMITLAAVSAMPGTVVPTG